MKNNSFYGTRGKWRLSRFRTSINLWFFYPAVEAIIKLGIFIFVVVYLNSKLKPIEHFEQHVIAKEIERQEKFIKESQEKELKKTKDYIEQLNLQQKYENEERQRKLHKKEIEECAKKYKIGDRIKIYDMNAPLIKENDHYRWSIGSIDVITNIVDLTIFCASGAQYSYNEQIDKVSSKREWSDLVNMQLKGELFFVEN